MCNNKWTAILPWKFFRFGLLTKNGNTAKRIEKLTQHTGDGLHFITDRAHMFVGFPDCFSRILERGVEVDSLRKIIDLRRCGNTQR